MHLVLALVMIRENLDHPAFANLTVATFIYHSLQLRTQGFKPCDALVDLGQMPPRDAIGLMAGALWLFTELKKLTNVRNIEAQLTGMFDERKTIEILLIELTAVPLAALRRWKQSDLLIKSDGRHLYAGLSGGFTDG